MQIDHPQRFRTPRWRLLPALVLVGLLAACGTVTNVAAPEAADRFAYTLTVEVAADASKETVEAEYGGSAVVFRPEAGFAILGLDAETGAELSLQARRTTRPSTETYALEPTENLDQLVIPEAFAAGFTSWSGGFTSWSGGFTSWSGGFTSWSGGFTSWSGGSPEPTTFAENVPMWQQIRLAEGQQLAPNLGAGVKVAVIDTGIDLAHPAFEGHLAPQSEYRRRRHRAAGGAQRHHPADAGPRSRR
jgi:hypothetical protein